MLRIKKRFGVVWQLIFYHDASGGWFDAETALCNNNEKLFSAIGLITSDYKHDGYYEYLIEYPELTDYIRWQQKVAIADTSASPTKEEIGYKKIHVEFTEREFDGIARSSRSESIFDGTSSAYTYWYSIGATKGYFEKQEFPGPYIGDTEKGVKFAYLWIRVPTKYLCTMNYQKCKSNSFVFYIICLLIS